MKIARFVFPMALCCTVGTTALGQGFINLNFEQAVITPDPSSLYYPYAVFASNAIPGWTALGFISPRDVLYNDISLGAASVSLFGTQDQYGPNSLDQNYSIGLYGGVEGPAAGASISQTAVVPVNAVSIQFIAQGQMAPLGSQFGGPLLVSLGGQNIPLIALSNGPNYTIYGGNVASFAGHLEQLIFDAPQGINNYWEIDDIGFFPTPVPEPKTMALLAIYLGLIIWRLKPRKLTGRKVSIGEFVQWLFAQ